MDWSVKVDMVGGGKGAWMRRVFFSPLVTDADPTQTLDLRQKFNDKTKIMQVARVENKRGGLRQYIQGPPSCLVQNPRASKVEGDRRPASLLHELTTRNVASRVICHVSGEYPILVNKVLKFHVPIHEWSACSRAASRASSLLSRLSPALSALFQRKDVDGSQRGV